MRREFIMGGVTHEPVTRPRPRPDDDVLSIRQGEGVPEVRTCLASREDAPVKAMEILNQDPSTKVLVIFIE